MDYNLKLLIGNFKNSIIEGNENFSQYAVLTYMTLLRNEFIYKELETFVNQIMITPIYKNEVKKITSECMKEKDHYHIMVMKTLCENNSQESAEELYQHLLEIYRLFENYIRMDYDIFYWSIDSAVLAGKVPIYSTYAHLEVLNTLIDFSIKEHNKFIEENPQNISRLKTLNFLLPLALQRKINRLRDMLCSPIDLDINTRNSKMAFDIFTRKFCDYNKVVTFINNKES